MYLFLTKLEIPQTKIKKAYDEVKLKHEEAYQLLDFRQFIAITTTTVLRRLIVYKL